MASSRAPKIIQIQKGDHHLSSHLTSFRTDEIHAVAANHAPEILKPKEIVKPVSVTMNLIQPEPTAQEKIRERMWQLQKKIKSKKEIVKQPTPTPTAHKKRERPPEKIRIPRNKTSIAFILIAFLLVTPLKAVTTYEQVSKFRTDVEEIKSSAAGPVGGDLSQVNELVTKALRSFHNAQNSLHMIDGAEEFVLRHTPFFGERFGVASRLVAAGEHTSLAAASYMQLFRTLKTKAQAPLIERLTLFFEGNRAVLTDLSAAAELVRPIDTAGLPENQREFIKQARDSILALHNDADYLSSAGPVILSMLGNVSPRRYLVVFQNPTELRPTGGFIGSFALLDVENGEIKNLQIPAGGSYDLQGTLKKHLRAPLPLHIINSEWQFQDGNWFPDFPTSAQKLAWFLEKSQGPSVDGVIAINATLLPQLLAVVGPVSIPQAATQLTAENALATVRESINVAASAHDTKPKQIISSAAPALIETLKAGKAEHFLPLITELLKSLENRDIQLYARDEELQKRITDFGWDGGIRTNPSGDFLSVIATNIGGQKTDSLINQTIDHQARIAPDGSITVTVHIKREQRLSDKAFEGGPNVSYIRYYVPLGSTIISAQGFTFPSDGLFQAPELWQKEDAELSSVEREIAIEEKSGTRVTEEFGHTVFGNWMITQPNMASETTITYSIPHKIEPQKIEGLKKIASYFYDAAPLASYSLYVQRQSGASPTTITSRVILPDEWTLGWVTDKRAQTATNGILMSVPFTNDIHFAVTAYATNNKIDTSEKK